MKNSENYFQKRYKTNKFHSMKTENKIFRSLVASTLICLTFAIVSSCKSGPQDVLPTSQQVWDYYYSTLNYSPEYAPGFAAYFDFSDGMSEAYKDQDTRENLRGISQKVTGTDWKIYGLASNQVTEMNCSQTELYNKITQNRYTEIMAPIEEALKSIVENRQRALLITDFEEYTADRHIQYQNYAKKYFIDWMKAGGVINFYITDYKEGKQDKHLYFTVFDDYKGTMTKIIDDALAGRTVNYKKFSINNKPVEVFCNYFNTKKGGNYHDSTGQDLVTAVNEDDPSNDMYTCYEKGHVEFYPCFGSSWADIKKNADAVAQMPGNDKFYSLWRGIFLDSSNRDAYIIEPSDYVLKVTNVQKDFQLFTDYNAALRNTPTISRNPDGTVFVESTEHPDAEYYYNLETGEMLPDFVYKPQNCPIVHNLFEFDADVMAESLRDNPYRTEIAIDFSQYFSESTLDVQYGDLIRIDIMIANATPNLDKLSELFAWGPDKNGQKNENLSEAIRNTLQESSISPVGQILFTYFVKAY